MNNSEDHLENACTRLADYLVSHKQEIIGEWVAQVRQEHDAPSDALTRLEIVDHIPDISDAMIQALRNRCSDTALEQVKKVADRHTIIRWVQGYDLLAVLNEVSVLRAVFIRHLSVFDELHPDFGNDAQLFNSTTIHGILDEIITDATDAFLKLKARGGGDEA